ncbi:MAG TPA: monovalent cation:proton antiporter-2 (CPA2) family protein [Nannocystaceae bacterium]|nr:monovalent cation:proton antiporter-2 (CPA2) family protein [Nannocystaceae bacterium]
MSDDLLTQAVVYLCVSVIFVPIAKRLGLGAVLGYLFAGAMIGPWVLGLVGTEGHDVMHFAEFGVVMMMFLVGLELRPALLWELRRPILGLGGLQVIGCAAAVAGLAILVGVPPRAAVGVGFLLAMSSTAIVLASLGERSLLKTPGGQASFSILLFQDIAVIPILALFPLLGDGGGTVEQTRPAWQSALVSFGAVGVIVLAGRYLVRPVFQFLASTRLRESFIAFALFIVVGIAALMELVGLSAALGTFMAGVVLADSEYRHELESDIEPFKGLLLGLFFISIGAQIDFGLLASEPATILGIVAATMTVKGIVLYALGRGARLDRRARWLLAFALPQIGEFAFVLVSFGEQNHVFDTALGSRLVAAIAISMAMTPLFFIALERWILPALAEPADARPQDTIAHSEGNVVIAGYGRFGQIVGRILRANGIKMTVLDLDPEMVDVLGRLGIKVHYGDASRLDLLEAAGCARADLFVLAIDDAERAVAVAEVVRRTYPKLTIVARAFDRPHYIELRRVGVTLIHRETFASAFEAAIDGLRVLGYRAHTAHRLAQRWRAHEERELAELMKIWDQDEDVRFARVRLGMQEAERLMREEDPQVYEQRDAAWDDESLRRGA